MRAHGFSEGARTGGADMVWDPGARTCADRRSLASHQADPTSDLPLLLAVVRGHVGDEGKVPSDPWGHNAAQVECQKPYESR